MTLRNYRWRPSKYLQLGPIIHRQSSVPSYSSREGETKRRTDKIGSTPSATASSPSLAAAHHPFVADIRRWPSPPHHSQLRFHSPSPSSVGRLGPHRDVCAAAFLEMGRESPEVGPYMERIKPPESQQESSGSSCPTSGVSTREVCVVGPHPLYCASGRLARDPREVLRTGRSRRPRMRTHHPGLR